MWDFQPFGSIIKIDWVVQDIGVITVKILDNNVSSIQCCIFDEKCNTTCSK